MYGEKQFFEETSISVNDGFTDVFRFEMLEGTAEIIREPEKMILPQSIARRIFGDVPAMDGQIILNGTSYTISGIYKDFPENSSLRNAIYYSMRDENKDSFGNFNYAVFVRLTSSDLMEDVMANYHEKVHPELFKPAFGVGPEEVRLRLTPLTELHYIKNVEYDLEEKSSRETVFVMLVIAIALLIIAGINFTNFSMALTPMRVKSINTQKVLGTETGLLRKGILGEAIVICFVSYGLSLLVVKLFTQTELRQLVSGNVALGNHVDILLISFGLAIVVALFAGIYPAYYMTSFPPALVLKGSFGMSPKGRSLRNGLLGFQFIASFALIIGAGFMYLQNHFMRNSPLGYDRDELIVAQMSSTLSKNRDAIMDELKQFSGIEDITCAQFMLSSSDRYMGWGRGYQDREISFQCFPVDPSFLQVMGIQISEGRDFRREDERGQGGAYIFNERARQSLDLELGGKIDGVGEIIGFMPDVKFASFSTDVIPMAFYVWGTDSWGSSDNNRWMYVRVAAGSDLRAAHQYVLETFQKYDPGFPFKVGFFDDILQFTYEKECKITLLITLFSLVAIFISIVGVFGLVVFESQYRIREIGVRKVLGSSTQEILVMFNKVYFRILVICFALAAPLACLLVYNWLENFAYRTPMYWWVFLAAFFIVALITFMTVTFQNWRAANVNPVESLKNE